MKTRDAKRRRRPLRWLKHSVLTVIAVVVLATAATIAIVHTEWGKNKIRGIIVEQLQRDFPGSTIASLSGSPFGTIVLRGITLNTPDEQALVTVAELRLHLSLRYLLVKRAHIDDLAVTGVHIFVRKHPPQLDVDAREAPPSPTPFTIELPAIAVRDAVVTIETPTGNELIDQVSVYAAARVAAHGGLITAAANIEGRWRGKPLHVHALGSIGDTVHVQLATASVGDATMVATGFDLGDYTVIGSVTAFVPAALIHEMTGKEVPGDITLAATGRPGGSITLAATAGNTRVSGNLIANLVAFSVRGIVTADVPDLAVLTGGKVLGAGTMVAAIEASPGRARGIATLTGELHQVPGLTELAGTTTYAFDAWLTHVELVGTAQVAQGTASFGAYVEQRDDIWYLVSSDVVAKSRDLPRLASADATASASGVLYPKPSLDVRGTLVASGVKTETTRVAHIAAQFAGRYTPLHQQVKAELAAADVVSGTTRVPSVAVVADVGLDEADILLALGAHRVRTQDGALWTGTGGRVMINSTTVTIDRVQTGTGGSKVMANARVSLIDDSLSAKVTARNVALSLVRPMLGGRADADLDVARKHGQWKGSVKVRAYAVSLPGRPVVDASIDVALAGRMVSLDGSVTNPQLGTATVSAVVTGPRHLMNPLAWQSLPRSAIDHVTLTFAHLDAAPLGHTGTLDGELTIDATDARGELRVGGVETKVGLIDADVAIASADAGMIGLHATARTPGFPPSSVDATVALPPRPFDPLSWRRLGRKALHAATVKAAGHVDPTLLARFGLVAPYAADVAALVTVLPGAASANLSVDVTNLKGGMLRAPVNVHLDAVADANGMSADARVTSGKLFATLVAKSPQTIEQALAPNAPPAPIVATLTFPDVAARDLLTIFGRTNVVAGTVGGTVTIGGTVADPTVHAVAAAHGLAVKASGFTNKRAPTLDLLELDARYAKGRVNVELMGHEGKDRLLKISAAGDPSDPHSIIASIEAANFDIAPLAAFGTGPIRGASGTLTTALKIRGLDPQAGDIRGTLTIRDGRMPLSAVLGTLRSASLDVEVSDQKITASFDGHLGAGDGTVSGKVTGDVVGGLPTTAHLEMKLRKVSPIGAVQPQVDADITGNWADRGELWTGSMAINHANIYLPPEVGNELLVAGAPEDMIFVDKQLGPKKPRHVPTKPWLVTKIAIGDTNVDVEDADYRLRLVVRGALTVELGDGIGIYGQIFATRGALDIAARRYRVEQAVVDFDNGSIDPRLDIRISHDFKNMTLKVDIEGRASKPVPHLSGDPGSYSEGQLLSFLAGAEPSDQDSTSQQNQAAVSGGLALLSGRIGKRINKHLPVKFDTINYEADTVSSSKAVRFGMQLTQRSYLVWRQHVAPRADENLGEAVFEYQFRSNLIFEATIGERAQGGDFLWRKRW